MRWPIAAILSAALTGCSFYRVKNQQTAAPVPPPPAGSLSFQKIHGDLFTPYCSPCHTDGGANGGVTLDTYAEVKGVLTGANGVQGQVDSKAMPYAGTYTVPPAIIAELDAWVAAGAPETATGQ